MAADARLLLSALPLLRPSPAPWPRSATPRATPCASSSTPTSRAPTAGQPAWDEQETATALPASSSRFPWATQAVQVGSEALPIDADRGWAVLDLGHRADLFGLAAQGWVTVLKSNRVGATAHDAAVLQGACDIQ